MSDTVAVNAVKIDYIEKTLSEILACVKETNGKVREHDVGIAQNDEWKKTSQLLMKNLTARFDKLENRLWLIMLSGTIAGTIAGAIASIYTR